MKLWDMCRIINFEDLQLLNKRKLVVRSLDFFFELLYFHILQFVIKLIDYY